MRDRTVKGFREKKGRPARRPEHSFEVEDSAEKKRGVRKGNGTALRVRMICLDLVAERT